MDVNELTIMKIFLDHLFFKKLHYYQVSNSNDFHVGNWTKLFLQPLSDVYCLPWVQAPVLDDIGRVNWPVIPSFLQMKEKGLGKIEK